MNQHLDVQCISRLLQNKFNIHQGDYEGHYVVFFDTVAMYQSHPILADVFESDPAVAKCLIVKNLKLLVNSATEVSLVPVALTSCLDSQLLLQWKSCFVILYGFIIHPPKAVNPVIYSVSTTHIVTDKVAGSVVTLCIKPSLQVPPEGTLVSVCGVLDVGITTTYNFPHLIPTVSVHAIIGPLPFPPVFPLELMPQISPIQVMNNIFQKHSKLVFAFLLSIVSSYLSLERPQKLHISFRRNEYKYAQQLVKLAPYSSFPLKSDHVPEIKNSIIICPSLSNLKVKNLMDSGSCIWAIGGEASDPFDFFL
ncbi:hypothetical protein RCL1_002798 [Eukaryota sp. TZLM3-RCL]